MRASEATTIRMDRGDAFATVGGAAIGPWHDDIRLGRTRFAELSSSPRKWAMSMGAHSYGYTEEHYFGNPGNYWTWYCGLCEVGYCKFFGQPFIGQSADGTEQPEEAIGFRATTSINSAANASAAAIDLRLYSPGPYPNQAFSLQAPGMRNSWRRWRLQRKVYGMAPTPRRSLLHPVRRPVGPRAPTK
jgi:hypothetical protein